MLPAQYKLENSEAFRSAIRFGKRAGRSTVVVHLHLYSYGRLGFEVPFFGGPRAGLVVSKAVGNAVTRHQVSRRLRHIFMQLIDDIPADAQLVIRALPAAATASYEQLADDVSQAYLKCLKRYGTHAEHE